MEYLYNSSRIVDTIFQLIYNIGIYIKIQNLNQRGKLYDACLKGNMYAEEMQIWEGIQVREKMGVKFMSEFHPHFFLAQSQKVSKIREAGWFQYRGKRSRA